MTNYLASDIFYLIITAIQFLAGAFANGFIVGLNCIDWAQRKTLTPFDMILTSLAFSRFCLQFLVTLDNSVFLLYPNFYTPVQRIQSFEIIWLFINNVNVCFSSCLSLYYCVKIATFKHFIFNWLKLRLSILVPWLLFGSVLYSMVIALCFTIFSYSYSYWISSGNSTDNLSNNGMLSERKKKDTAELTFWMHSMGSILPLSIFITSSVMLILSLWRHIGKMNQNSVLNPGFRNPSTDTHVHALKSLLSFFILHVIYCVASILSIGNLPYIKQKWKIMVCILVSSAYPFLHSFILILGNPKLKLASSRILHSTNSCFRETTS
ncbi:taste receptor type 2 member 7-like [Carettochelys insculpta]|uniref:taste receptor type 2 member 7-like n=1 Tax=Carettochelys insculpta TaxID=44489 RepID=UPI003EB74077